MHVQYQTKKLNIKFSLLHYILLFPLFRCSQVRSMFIENIWSHAGVLQWAVLAQILFSLHAVSQRTQWCMLLQWQRAILYRRFYKVRKKSYYFFSFIRLSNISSKFFSCFLFYIIISFVLFINCKRRRHLK